MTLNEQLKDIQVLINKLETSKNYYRKQFEASIDDNILLNSYVKKLNKINLYLIGGIVILTCGLIYSITRIN